MPKRVDIADDFALVTESRGSVKGKGKSKGLIYNVKKSRMMTSSDKARNINKEGSFFKQFTA